MPQKDDELQQIKSKQYVLIAKAGLSILSAEMDSKTIFHQMFKQFKAHVDKIKLPPHYSKDIFFRTSGHLQDIVTAKEMHDGSSLWRKYSAIKKYINNQITPIFVKFLGPDGKPPSGQNMESVLLQTKKALYEQEQLAAKARSKHPPSFKMKPFKPSDQPCEWDTFLQFGRASEKPEKAFFIE